LVSFIAYFCVVVRVDAQLAYAEGACETRGAVLVDQSQPCVHVELTHCRPTFLERCKSDRVRAATACRSI